MSSNGHLHLKCNFCGKTAREVEYLIAGPAVYICNECVGLCVGIIDESKADARGVSGAMCVVFSPDERAAIGEETER